MKPCNVLHCVCHTCVDDGNKTKWNGLIYLLLRTTAKLSAKGQWYFFNKKISVIFFPRGRLSCAQVILICGLWILAGLNAEFLFYVLWGFVAADRGDKSRGRESMDTVAREFRGQYWASGVNPANLIYSLVEYEVREFGEQDAGSTVPLIRKEHQAY